MVLAVDEEAFWLEPRPLLARLAEGLPLLRGAREGEGFRQVELEGGLRVRVEVLVRGGEAEEPTSWA